MALWIDIALEPVRLIKEQRSPYLVLDQVMAKFGVRAILTHLNRSDLVGLFVVFLVFI